jgi:hypothetical protein
MAQRRKTGGRQRGTPNKATAEARNVFAEFVDANADKAQELWERVAKEDPAKALDLLAKLAEFTIPKLSRSTIDGDVGVRGTLVIRE